MERIDQRASKASERVFDFGRDDRMNLAQDESVSLQTAKSLCEHFLRNPTDFPLQRCVSVSPVGQDLDDERSPFIRDPVQDYARRTLRF